MIYIESGQEFEILAFDREAGTVTFAADPRYSKEPITVDWPTDEHAKAKRKKNYRLEKRDA